MRPRPTPTLVIGSSPPLTRAATSAAAEPAAAEPAAAAAAEPAAAEPVAAVAPAPAPAPAASSLPEGWVEYKDPNGKSYYHNTAANTTTWTRPVGPASSDAQYPIPVDAVESSDEDSEGEEMELRAPAHAVPNWASSARVAQAVATQQQVDADLIFNQNIHRREQACDLAEIFGRQRTPPGASYSYHRRNSSGHWLHDMLDDDEEVAYKRARGF